MRRELIKSSRVSASVPPMLETLPLSMMGDGGAGVRLVDSPRIAVHLIVFGLLCHVEGGLVASVLWEKVGCIVTS